MTKTPIRLPVAATIAAAWRSVLSRPGAALRVAWMPAALILALRIGGQIGRAQEQGDFAAQISFTFILFALMVLMLVAWQRMVLFGPDQRAGILPLRLGRAEVKALAHFPLVLVLLVPMQVLPLVDWLAKAPSPVGGGFSMWLPWIGFAILIFPAGPWLARATLMIVGIAAAGSRGSESLAAAANRIWEASTGNTMRIFLILMGAGLPVAVVTELSGLLESRIFDFLPVLLTPLYILVVGGALAHAYAGLGALKSGGKT